MENTTVIETQMLIRKPAAEVFNAFIDPAVTKHFWFSKGSDKLEPGKTVTWTWEMYAASTKVVVKEIIENERISIDWGEPATMVDFLFTELPGKGTYVVIKNYGFKETGNDLIAIVKNNTGGFTTVLDGLKAYMEHGINLRLIQDKFPDKVVTGWDND